MHARHKNGYLYGSASVAAQFRLRCPAITGSLSVYTRAIDNSSARLFWLGASNLIGALSWQHLHMSLMLEIPDPSLPPSPN